MLSVDLFFKNKFLVKDNVFVLDENDNAIIDSGCTFRDEFPKPFEDDTISLLSLEEKLMQGE